eukprot:5673665-Pleurochrysis_carterae.AAC.3
MDRAKNEHRARVQRRWDNRGIMNEAFQIWKSLIEGGHKNEGRGQEHKDEEGKKEKTHGIQIWAGSEQY